MTKQAIFWLLLGIVLLGGFFRMFNLNWDSGFHMHPDERAIILSVIKLEFPSSFQEFTSPESLWNPKFFAYGSMPFYLLFAAGEVAGVFDPLLSEYDGINLVGRHLSVIFDLGTLLFVYLIGKILFSRKFGVLAASLYAVSVLPIQLSHFYAVDTILTFFITGTLYLLLRFLKEPSPRLLLAIGFFIGSAAATKISALVLLLPLGLTLLLPILRSISGNHEARKTAFSIPLQ